MHHRQNSIVSTYICLCIFSPIRIYGVNFNTSAQGQFCLMHTYMYVYRIYMKAIRRLGEWRYSSTILHLTVDGGKWSASRPRPFYLRGKSLDVHWLGGWEGHRASLDAVERRRLTFPCRELNTCPDCRPAVYRLSCVAHQSSGEEVSLMCSSIFASRSPLWSVKGRIF
jgi:hypothetical protein